MQNKQIFEKNWLLSKKCNQTDGIHGNFDVNGLHTDPPVEKVNPELLKIPRYGDLIGIDNVEEKYNTILMYR